MNCFYRAIALVMACLLSLSFPMIACASGMGEGAPPPNRNRNNNNAALGVGLMLLLNAKKPATPNEPSTELPSVRRVYGKVLYQASAGAAWTPLSVGMRLGVGATVRTGNMSSMEAATGSRGLITLAEKTKVEVRAADARAHEFMLLDGRVSNTVTPSRDRSYLVRTASAEVFVKGTEFDVEVDEQGRTVARSYSGSVGVRTPEREVTVEPGEEAVVKKDGTIESLGRIKGAPPSPFGFTAEWFLARASAERDESDANPVSATPVGGTNAAPRRAPADAALINPSSYSEADQALRIQGALTVNDPKRENGTHYHRHVIAVRAGEVYTVQLIGMTYDPYLIVKVPGGGVFENDNGARNTYTSQLQIRIPRDGELEILSTTPNSPVVGRYKLYVCRESNDVSTASATQAAPTSSSPSVASNDAATVKLTWLPSSGARLYRVYKLEEHQWKRLDETDASGVNSAALPRGASHILCVTAVGEDGESKPGENALLLSP